MIKNPDFQNWVFHYNPYEGVWFAIPRHLYVQFWNDRNTEGIIKSKDIKVLIEIIDSSEIESYK